MPAIDSANSPPLGRLLAIFFVGGLLLFGAERLFLSEEDTSRRIVVTRSLKAHLTRELVGELGREPTPSELARRVDRWRLDEVAYREGVRAGLDRGEAVRNEVVRAYRTLAVQLAVVPEPSAAELGTASRSEFRAHALREADTRALKALLREYEIVEAP